MIMEKYTIESEDSFDIELAIKAKDMYSLLYSHQQDLRSICKYGKPTNEEWEEVFDRLYQDINEGLYNLGIEE